MSKFLIIYASTTGNTKMIAEEIYNSIKVPDYEKELVDIRNWNGTHEGETYFIGFWVNRGTCSLEIIDLLSSLHGKNIALFGTCGTGDKCGYFSAIEKSVTAWVADDNNYLGSYFCQGKMPARIRVKYECLSEKVGKEKADLMIANYDEALKHPDKQDLLKANIFADEVIKKAK